MSLSWRWSFFATSFLTALGLLSSDIDFRSREEANFRDQMLDVVATVYLPPTSAAQRVAFSDCANPLIEFTQEHSEPYPEKLLFERARALQKRLFPLELVNGPFMTADACRTPNCDGTVKLAELPLIRAFDAIATAR